MASVLGRTLVLPDLWCGADRWWAPHQGTIPGSALLLPFRCPADHVLDLGRWSPKPQTPCSTGGAARACCGACPGGTRHAVHVLWHGQRATACSICCSILWRVLYRECEGRQMG